MFKRLGTTLGALGVVLGSLSSGGCAPERASQTARGDSTPAAAAVAQDEAKSLAHDDQLVAKGDHGACPIPGHVTARCQQEFEHCYIEPELLTNCKF